MDIKKNLSDTSIWLRLLWMAIYITILYVLCLPALVLIMLFQFCSYAITGQINQSLNRGARYVAEYIADVVKFLSFVSDEKPFPLNSNETAPKSEETAPKKAKTATRKTTTTKNTTTTKKS